MNVGDIIEWSDGKTNIHRWRVRGNHLEWFCQECGVEIETGVEDLGDD